MKSCLRRPAHVTFAFIAALPSVLGLELDLDRPTNFHRATGLLFFLTSVTTKKNRLDEFSFVAQTQHSFVLGSNQFTASQNRQLEETVSAFFSSSSISFHLRHPPPRKPQICGFELILGPCCGGLSESDSQ